MTSSVLVIEDEAAIAEMYRFKLHQAGYETRVAADGAQGLAMAEAHHPDLLLLDLRLPTMNGETVLEHIRATDWGGKIRVIILTNISKDESPMSLRFLNVDRYIVKAHTTPKQVVEIVNELFGIKN